MFDTEPSTNMKPATVHLVAPSPKAASGPVGHGGTRDHRGFGRGVFSTHVPSPVIGAKRTPEPYLFAPVVNDVNWSSLLPQLDFPKFDGANPKIWKKKV